MEFKVVLFVIMTFLVNDGRSQGVSDYTTLDQHVFSILNLTGNDALNRPIETAVVDNRMAKHVGVFYSLWLGHHNEGIYDIQKLLDAYPEALYDTTGNPRSPLEEFHFWGEPLYGYYNMKDPWVVTRHVELLTNASIDFLCIDATNTFIYPEQAKNLFTALQKFQHQGFKVPKVVFYTNTRSGITVDKIYRTFYKSGNFDDIWYKPNEKPMIIGITKDNNNASDMTKYHSFDDYIKPPMMEYFDVRESQWPNGDYNKNGVPWMSWNCPQKIHNGTVAVPVAQHSHSVIYASSMHPECSRGYNNETREIDSNWRAGSNFQTMWNAVFDRIDEIDNVMVTSFNEWMAIKYNNNGQVMFVDVFNHEFSRDIEMMKGGYQDNFYMQLVRNVRRFKFEEGVSFQLEKETIDIGKYDEELWENAVTYVDFAGDAIERDFINAAGTGSYIDTSNRNDIVDVKIMHDDNNIYLRIKTLNDIILYNGQDHNWMNVLIRSEGENTFEGYHYVINRRPGESGFTSIEKSTGGYNWIPSGQARYSVDGSILVMAIPFQAIGIASKRGSIEFKVSDNVTQYDNIMDYYVTGDSAPLGRLNFNYSFKKTN